MKKQDIAALIDGKIKGQGSAIDIGNALPAILGGLNENSVAEDMTETAQMQMRKNLGLYYEEESTQKINFDAAGTFKRYPGEPGGSTRGWYLSSDAILSKDAVEGQKIKYGEDEIEITAAMCVDGVKGFVIYEDPDASTGPMALIALEDGATLDGASSLAAGVWLFKAGADTKAEWLEYAGTTISKVPEKFLPAAPVPDEVEGNPTVPGGTSPTPLENLRINDDYFSIPQGDEVEGNPTVPGGTSPTPMQNIKINNDYFAIPQVKAVVLTDIPLGPTMTQAALDAIGLTTSEVAAAARGNRTGCIVMGNFRLICVAQYQDDNNYRFAVATPVGEALSFWFLVSCEGGSITVTNY